MPNAPACIASCHHQLHALELIRRRRTIGHPDHLATNAVVTGEVADVETERERVDHAEIGSEMRGPAAIGAAQREGHALADFTLRVGHPVDALDVGMEVDESGRDDQAGRIDHPLGR
jgi:hypothetical protein